MDDALGVGFFQGLGDLPGDGERIFQGQRALLHVFGQRVRAILVGNAKDDHP